MFEIALKAGNIIQLIGDSVLARKPKKHSPWKKLLIFQEIQLSCLNIKQFLNFRKWNHAVLFPNPKKVKKPPAQKFLIFSERNFLPLVLKKFPIFFQKNGIYYIPQNGTLPFFAQALKIKELSTLGKLIVIPKTETPPQKKLLYFRKRNFLIFWAPRLKNFW